MPTYPLPTALVENVTQGHMTRDHFQMHGRYNMEGPKVKADFGAVGDSNHTSGGGTDDTTAFQNAINAATTTPTRFGQVLVEPGTYRITSPLKMFKSDGTGGNVRLVGLGARSGTGIRGPILVWDGPTDGTPRAMLDYDTTGPNVGQSPILNLTLAGRAISNATGIRYRKKVDIGTFWDNCEFQRWNGPAMIYDIGSTNGYGYRSRFDGCKVAVDYTAASYSVFGMSDITVDNFSTDHTPTAAFIFRRDNDDVNDRLDLYLQNIHTETQTSWEEVEASGAEPADRRGEYHFITHAAHASTQFIVNINGFLRNPKAAGVASYSVFLIRGDGTAAQRGRRIIINGSGSVITDMNGDGSAATDHKVPIGNVAAAMQPSGTGNMYPDYKHAPQNTEITASSRAQTWQYTGTD